MTYTPAKTESIAIGSLKEGCAQLSEEEFQDLESKAVKLLESREAYSKAYDAILFRYKRKRVTRVTEDGHPGSGFMISGNLIVPVVYE